MENEEKENVGADATIKENAGADNATETKKSFDELLQDKEYQSAFDKKIAQSLQTAKTKWQEDLEKEKAEAERMAQMSEEEKRKVLLKAEKERADKAEKTLNAYKLKDETIRQANEKGIPLELIQTLDFEVETAESIYNKLTIFEKTSKSVREKAINEYSKETPPQTGDYKGTQKSENEMTYEELCNLPKYKN